MKHELGIMKKRWIKFIIVALFLTPYSLFPKAAFAVCPVCTIAVGAGLGLSRVLGIDDTISGVWVGGLILSSSLWLADWLGKKNERFNQLNSKVAIAFFFFAIVLIPLWLSDIIGHPFNTILGLDKLIFGTAVGSFVFLGAVWADKKVRETRGKQLFNYQKIVFPLAGLLIASFILFLITSVKINYRG